MSLADESNVSHRPPQVGDRVEVRLVGTVTTCYPDGVLRVTLDDSQFEGLPPHRTTQPAEQVAILRDVPRYAPGRADRP